MENELQLATYPQRARGQDDGSSTQTPSTTVMTKMASGDEALLVVGEMPFFARILTAVLLLTALPQLRMDHKI